MFPVGETTATKSLGSIISGLKNKKQEAFIYAEEDWDTMVLFRVIC
jgi:hypothetical protein